VYCLQFRGEWLITGSRDKTIRIWRLSPVDLQGNVGKTRLMRTVLEAHAGSVLSLDFEIAAAGDDAEEVEGRKPKDKAQKGMIVTGSSDMTAGIWDVDFPTSDESKSKKPRVERIGILRGHIGGVLDVCLGKRHIVTCSKDASIRVFDRASLQHLRTIGGHDGPVNCLSLNPDREIGQVVSASGDGSWVIWDLGTGEQILRGGGDGRGLACVVWEVG
jgi:WD40 repeat protein